MSATVDILRFYWHQYNQLLRIKMLLILKHWYWDLNFTNNTNFQSLEVVDRGSETQLLVAENLKWKTQCYKS